MKIGVFIIKIIDGGYQMKKILIIEDEKNLARFVELELNHEGIETEVYLDGRSGLEAAVDESKKWDLILLDLIMPLQTLLIIPIMQDM